MNDLNEDIGNAERLSKTEPGGRVPMFAVLLISGAEAACDITSPEVREKATRVRDELLACAVKHGFRNRKRLRVLLDHAGQWAATHGFEPVPFTKEAIALARDAIDAVPARAVCDALERADALELLTGDAATA
ncbi:hypothetical protein [Paraburkholderia ferrariae]|uniref:Uncharacterized protein n=1 Tax=Paraburkholderia ferrariae TaxID=386056 RepID=A0ABU9RJG2_9BURK